jgi:hypothetical protein
VVVPLLVVEWAAAVKAAAAGGSMDVDVLIAFVDRVTAEAVEQFEAGGGQRRAEA